eukprot:Sdes_comp10292_c0_seq1m1926
MSCVSFFMSNLQYPEFLQFSLTLSRNIVYGEEPISGFVTIAISENHQNCVQDVVIECNCTFECENLEKPNSSVKEVIWHSAQRNATTFDDEGLPGGLYEVPFYFRLPKSAPPSFESSFFSGTHKQERIHFKYTYTIHAIILNSSENPLQRKSLRKTARFERFIDSPPNPPLPKQNHSKCSLFFKNSH